MRKLLSTAAAAAAILAAASTPAHARIVVNLIDVTGGATVTCDTGAAFTATNCGAGFSTAPNANSFGFSTFPTVSFAGGGNWTLGGQFSAGTVGQSNQPGTPLEAKIDATNLQLVNLTGATRQFRIEMTSFGFTLPTSPFKTLFGSSSSNTASAAGTITSSFFADGTNAGLLSNQIGCGQVIGTNASCAATPANWLSGASFSLSMVQEFTIFSLQDVNATQSVSTRNTVPEPLSTSLVGAALLALALTSARRVSKKA